MSRAGVQELQVLIFFLAFFHVLSSLLTFSLGAAKVKFLIFLIIFAFILPSRRKTFHVQTYGNFSIELKYLFWLIQVFYYYYVFRWRDGNIGRLKLEHWTINFQMVRLFNSLLEFVLFWPPLIFTVAWNHETTPAENLIQEQLDFYLLVILMVLIAHSFMI